MKRIAMPVRISIDRHKDNSVTFETVYAALSDTVFWINNDPKAPHWPAASPTQPFTRSQIGPAPSPNSDSFSVFVKGNTPPYQIKYGCIVSQHTQESGLINVYLDFGPAGTAPATIPANAPFSLAVTAGGVGPYTFAVAPAVPLGGGQVCGVPPGLSLAALSTGVVLSGTPTQKGPFLFTLQASDSLQNSFEQQNYAIVVS
jgi:hypothetical protein